MRFDDCGRALPRLLWVLACGALAACSATAAAPETASITSAPSGNPAWSQVTITPVALIGARPTEMPIADAGIERAVNMYRLQRGEPVMPFARAGADLNGDGVAEVVAYVSTPNCAAAGCALLIFAAKGDSYQLLSRVENVLPPVGVAVTSHGRWRDLSVRTASGKTVQVGFGSNGYTADATLLAEGPPGVEILIASAQANLPLPAAIAAVPAKVRPLAKTAPAWSNYSLGGDAEEAAAGQ